MDTNKDLAVKTIKDRAGDGTVREYTAPNLEVRIGVIYALERIAQDSGQDHTHIMAVLCAYIRNNAPLGSKDRDVWDIFGKKISGLRRIWRVDYTA